ncbi:MAG: hypothetical protein P8I03_05845 [Thalassotalea sp.]|nr:hypothetical protein [Thalassotalea sp.]
MKKLQLCTIGLSLLYIPQSFADITFNGFASIRATQANSDGGGVPFGSFDEGEISFKGESLFALQASADLTEGLTATIQLYADGSNDFDVEARWAYISYELADNHSISAGRLVNPTFHQSEYQKVGYAHNFSRLPIAVYQDFPFSTVEGIALNSQFELVDGDYSLETKLLYGSWNGDIYLDGVGNVDLGLKDILSVNATLSGDWWKIFSGAFITEMKADSVDANSYIPAIQPGIQAALSLGATQSDVTNFTNAVAWDKKDGLYWFAGFGVDYEDWLIDFEYTNYGVQDSVDAPNENWYLAVGRRFDSYVVTIHTEESKQPDDYGFLNGINHPVLQATGKGLQGAISTSEFEGYGISLRYDFHPSAALKVDYSAGEHQLTNIGDYQIMSIGVDLVF